ncbi:nicotinate phosphoribosyltransferase [Geminocystis sp. NIES-3709]|uniref:nicotinate phosphoribosyltransferase n=1 Tax=Geminocystis sp. NIES-3709 TaxID=1617448 RepID=UPI0005FC4892|nr:nicotinate phosphoribosyltransferase [Geminocystis sp. NIES-3709]BAQ64899.1 nicotinamide phosphoribosyltransferase [Geminocystis sp. NIES-3709]
MNINPLNAIDFYKTDHRRQYPEGTTEVYANFTPRSGRLAKVLDFDDIRVVFFGLQYFIQDYLIDCWHKNFFEQDKNKVVSAYKRRMDTSLGVDAISIEHIEELHDFGYLPLKIKALPEGSLVPIGIPVLTVVNTHPDFFWLTNYIESVMSSYLWKPITSATTAFQYKKLVKNYAIKTGTPLDFILFQCHDFSFRGLSGVQDAIISGAAHLTSFCGTDTVLAIDLLEEYYNASADQEMIGVSVPATEHSVMAMGMEDGELETFRRLIEDLYPKGIVSVVSDTWDFWKVITQYTVILKNKILARDGKLVIRPDSGDPVKIICGDSSYPQGSPEYKGAVECLWEIFGGTVTPQGYKMLDSHIGLIYGDSITLDRAYNILKGLEEKGFASGNVVFGIGSYTYQYVTRDNFGFAVKATSGVVNGKRRDIFKNPKTDSGTKKSAKGLLRVEQEGNTFVLYEQQTPEQEKQGALKTVFEDGKLIKSYSLGDIRQRISSYL